MSGVSWKIGNHVTNWNGKLQSRSSASSALASASAATRRACAAPRRHEESML
jgi:hypothetical protein